MLYIWDYSLGIPYMLIYHCLFSLTVLYSPLDLCLHCQTLCKNWKCGKVKTVSNVLEKSPAAIIFILNEIEIPKLICLPPLSLLLLLFLRSSIPDQWAASGEDRAEEHNFGVEGALLPKQQPHWIWGQILREGKSTVTLSDCTVITCQDLQLYTVAHFSTSNN